MQANTNTKQVLEELRLLALSSESPLPVQLVNLMRIFEVLEASGAEHIDSLKKLNQ